MRRAIVLNRFVHRTTSLSIIELVSGFSAALELAKKTLAAVQGNSIDLETLEDIIMAQEYRLNIWPTPKPTEPPEVRQKLTFYFAHGMPADAAKDAIRLTVNHEGKCERSQEPTRR